jgi:membrane associated rhomboid family serine protease
MARRRLQGLEVIALVLINVVLFAYKQALSPLEQARLSLRYGAVPVVMGEVWQALKDFGPRWQLLPFALPIVTANYLHVDLEHLLGNMLFLWVFANVLSQAVGRVLLLVTYLVAGAVAVIVYVHTNPTSEQPMIGASGAIAGLEGAYFTLVLRWEVPHAKVWPLDGPIPAASLAFLAVCNFILDTGAFVGHSREHVAYGAHVGGFLGGAFVAMVIATAWTPKWREP